MSEFVYPFWSESGYGTGPGDEAAIKTLSRAVQRTEVFVRCDPEMCNHDSISTDVLLNLDNWR